MKLFAQNLRRYPKDHSGKGGGTHIVRWYGDCAALKTPFSKPHFSSTDPPFQALFQLQRPHFHFLIKSWISRPIFCWFWLNFSSWDTNYGKIYSRDPSFKPKKSVLETLFLKTRAAHTYPFFCQLPPQGTTATIQACLYLSEYIWHAESKYGNGRLNISNIFEIVIHHYFWNCCKILACCQHLLSMWISLLLYYTPKSYIQIYMIYIV